MSTITPCDASPCCPTPAPVTIVNGTVLQSAKIDPSGHLILSYTDLRDHSTYTIDAGAINGDRISTCPRIDNNGDLNITITSNNGTQRVCNVGHIMGKDGKDGKDGTAGVSVDKAVITPSGELLIMLKNANGTTAATNLGRVVGIDGRDGKDGSNGQDGASIRTATISNLGELILTMVDHNQKPLVANLGKVVGPTGAVGRDGASGSAGATGATGATGSRGPVGNTGRDDQDGDTITKTQVSNGDLYINIKHADGSVTQTNSGPVMGATGATGDKWDIGLKGETGSAGPSGVKGVNGVDGVPGQDSKDGATGASVVGAVMTNGKLTIQILDALNRATNIPVGNVIGPEGPAGAIGAKGPAGPKGQPGKDGKDGAMGANGGVNGRSVVAASVNPAGELVLRMSDKGEINAGNVRGPAGKDADAVASGTFVNGHLVLTTKGGNSLPGIDVPVVKSGKFDPNTGDLEITMTDNSVVNMGSAFPPGTTSGSVLVWNRP